MRWAVPAFALLLSTATVSAQAPRGDDGGAAIWAIAHHREAWRLLTAALEPDEPVDPIAWTARVAQQDAFGTHAELVVRQPHPGRGPARVAYLRSLGDNPYAQLRAVRAASPAIRLEDAARLIRVGRGAVDAEGCPAVGRLAARLPSIEVRAMPVDYLSVDGGGFEVTLTPTFRSERHYVVDFEENDLAKWCAEIVAAVVACEGLPAAK